jgi:hypothetical protein
VPSRKGDMSFELHPSGGVALHPLVRSSRGR